MQRRRSVHGAGATAKALIGAQVALSVALVMVAGLFVRSLSNLRGADLGFRPDGMLLIQLFPQQAPRTNASRIESPTIKSWPNVCKGCRASLRSASLVWAPC